jgi:hypothetical protein
MSGKVEKSTASSVARRLAPISMEAAWSVMTRSARSPAAPRRETAFSTNDRRVATARNVAGVPADAGKRSDRISSSSMGRFPSSSDRWMTRALARSDTGSVSERR